MRTAASTALRAGQRVRWCAIAVFGAQFLSFTSCKNDLDSVASVDLHADGPDRTTTNAEYLYSDSAIVRNRLRAGTVEEYMGKPSHTELSNGVELIFYTPFGKQGSILTAQRGTVRSDERLMRVAGNVVFVNAKGETLKTEELHWVQDSSIVRTDKPVTIIRQTDTIRGEGMEAAEDFSRYTILRPTGMIAVPAQDTLRAE
ncbi:MAG: LPS export ABC transporter periplasmic protein LptC [Flavobacteriales bacterium]